MRASFLAERKQERERARECRGLLRVSRACCGAIHIHVDRVRCETVRGVGAGVSSRRGEPAARRADARGTMVAAAGPTGILAGRPSLPAVSAAAAGCPQHKRPGPEPYISKHQQEQQRRHESDLYVRPSWTDAALALDQLEKVSTRSPLRGHRCHRSSSLHACI